MEKNQKKYVSILLNHCVVYLKLTWHCKSTILQLKKWKKEIRRDRHNDESLIMKEK